MTNTFSVRRDDQNVTLCVYTIDFVSYTARVGLSYGYVFDVHSSRELHLASLANSITSYVLGLLWRKVAIKTVNALNVDNVCI